MKPTVLISGVAGFIGAHCALKFMNSGYSVIGFDNLSRKGSSTNLQWLQDQGGDFEFIRCDITNPGQLQKLVESSPKVDVILHLAAQVAVTTSVENPRFDFEQNIVGSFNLLELARINYPKASFLYSSTNKVYGEMLNDQIVENDQRYAYKNLPEGISESTLLDFHSPYGCSKGAADQYVRDYSRIYGLKTVVFRQSCIYGTHQFGIEDQGWVAWFTIASILGRELTIYGDGKQIRDVLFIDDLVALYLESVRNIEVCAGKIYNVGGGSQYTLSLLELVEILESLLGRKIDYKLAPWRPGDQKVYVSDITKVRTEIGWRPTVEIEEGIRRLLKWVVESQDILKSVL